MPLEGPGRAWKGRAIMPPPAAAVMRRARVCAAAAPRRLFTVPPAAAPAAAPTWAFTAHPSAVSTVRRAALAPGASFYAAGSLAQLQAELRVSGAAQRANLASADYGVLELVDHDATAAWVADPANAAALEEPGLWQALYELRCSAAPVAALLPNGVVQAGPALLAPMVVCQPGTAVAAGLAPGGVDAAVAVMPGTSSALGGLGGGMGLYLATTGHALPAADALHAGLVTHVLETFAGAVMVCDSLCVLSEGRRFDHAVEAVDDLSVLDPPSVMSADADDESVASLGQLVEEAFGAATSREEAVQSLEKMSKGGEAGCLWADACLESLNAQPVWQVRLTVALVRAVAGCDVATCLALEHHVVSYIADRRRAGEDMDTAVTATAAAALYEELVELSQGDTGGDVAASWGGIKPAFPFGPDQVMYLEYMRQAQLTAAEGSPGKARRAEAVQAELGTLRGGLEAVRWMNVKSQLLDYVEDLVETARAEGLDTGPMGDKISEMLRDETGRRRLQPILAVAAERGELFVDGLEEEDLNNSGEINDAYRHNYAYYESRLQAEGAAKKSWTGGGGGGRRGGKGGYKGGRGKAKEATPLQLEMSFQFLESEYVIDWCGELGRAVASTRA